jgi:hypothetical protein
VRSWHGPRRDRNEWREWHGAGWHRADGQGRPRRARAQRPETLARAEPAAPAARPDDDLPTDVAAKVAEIRHKADVLLGQTQRFSPFSLDLHLVRQTASDYLPRTLELYRALPAGSADLTFTASGKTAHQELMEQLEILDAKLDEIARELHSEEVDRLLANRRFLEERLGQISA